MFSDKNHPWAGKSVMAYAQQRRAEHAEKVRKAIADPFGPEAQEFRRREWNDEPDWEKGCADCGENLVGEDLDFAAAMVIERNDDPICCKCGVRRGFVVDEVMGYLSA